MNGYGSVGWLIAAELLPTSTRAVAYPLVVSSTWIFHFAVGSSFWPMADAPSGLGLHGALWFFSALTTIGVAFVASCVPETSEMSNEEIADFFINDNDEDVLENPLLQHNDDLDSLEDEDEEVKSEKRESVLT